MVVQTGDILRWCITFVLLVFHISVTIFIFYMLKIRKNNMYLSKFYALYLMLSLGDIGTILNNFFASKIILVEAWKPWFYAHPTWDTIFTLASGYLIYFQSIIHAAISINRAWVAFSLHNSKRKAWESMGKYLLWTLPLLPCAILNVRFAGHMVYFWTAECELASKYAETYIGLYHSIAGPTVVIATSSISFIFAIITILRYRYLFKKYKTISSTIRQDLLLFGQAAIILVFQWALASYYIMRLIATANNYLDIQAFALKYFSYISDVISLCNPIALMVVCKFIRKDYADFILQRKTTFHAITPGNSSIARGSNLPFVNVA